MYEHNSQDETDAKKLDDPEAEDRKTYNKLIPLSVSPRHPALQEPCDLIFETPVGSAQQLSSPGLITPDRQRPQDSLYLYACSFLTSDMLTLISLFSQYQQNSTIHYVSLHWHNPLSPPVTDYTRHKL